MKSLTQMEQEFKELERRVQKLKQAEKELCSLDVKGFESTTTKIKSKLKDLDSVDEVEREISSLREKIKEKIEDLSLEVERIIKTAIQEANKAKNSFWLSALQITRYDFLEFSSEYETCNFSFKDAMARILELKDMAETLSIPTPNEADEQSPKEKPIEETHYVILDVSRSATLKEIQKAYREKILEYHPDKVEGWSKPGKKVPEWVKKESDEMTKKLNEAYDILSDMKKRRRYDKERGI